MKKMNGFAWLALISALLLLVVSWNIFSPVTPSGGVPSATSSASPKPVLTQPARQATETGSPGVSTAAPSSSPNPTSQKIHLVGYFYSPDANNQAASLPVDELTTLIYAFVDVSTSGECVSADLAADQKNFPQLQRLKQMNPQLELLVSVGGYSRSANFSDAVLTADSRKRFAQSCVRFMQQNGFDGIDIDWEVPVSGGAPGNTHRPEDKQNFTAMLAELRSQLDRSGGRQYLLTIAAPAGASEYANLELASIQPYLDWINLETYAVAVEGSPITNFNAPLYTSSTDPTIDSRKRLSDNADAAVNAYLQAGVPAAKILLGVPFYGRGWFGVPDKNHGLYQPHAAGEVNDPGVPKGTWKSGSAIDYRDLEKYYLSSYARFWNDEARAAWLYNPVSGIMISYEDPQSLGIKAEYALARHLGGVMIWQLSQDDVQNSLLNSLYAILFK